jgi:hypothetical protein
MISQRMFGRVPFVRKPHPYWADLRHATRAIAEKMPIESASVLLVGPGAGLFERLVTTVGHCAKTTPGVLLEEPTRSIALEGNLLVRVVDKDGVAREIEARQVTILEEQYREAGMPVPAWVAAGPFDLCVCELQVADLRRFRDLFEVIRPQMRPHGRIVVVCRDEALQSRAEMTRIIRSAFPVEGVSEILFSGSPGSRVARRLVERAISGKAASGRISKLRIAGMFAAAALTSWASARSVERQTPYKFAPHSTSLTMVIDLP